MEVPKKQKIEKKVEEVRETPTQQKVDEKLEEFLEITSFWKKISPETKLHVLEVFGMKQTAISPAIHKLISYFYGVNRAQRDDSDYVLLLIAVLSSKSSYKISGDQLIRGWSLIIKDQPTITAEKSTHIVKLILKLLPDKTEPILL